MPAVHTASAAPRSWAYCPRRQVHRGIWNAVSPLLQDDGGTSTVMRSFVLCGDRQLHDVHSKLRLSHPSGNAVQLHK